MAITKSCTLNQSSTLDTRTIHRDKQRNGTSIFTWDPKGLGAYRCHRTHCQNRALDPHFRIHISFDSHWSPLVGCHRTAHHREPRSRKGAESIGHPGPERVVDGAAFVGRSLARISSIEEGSREVWENSPSVREENHYSEWERGSFLELERTVGLRSVPQDFRRHFGSRWLQNRTNNNSYQTALHITLFYSLTPFFTQILRRNCKSHADMAGVVRKASVLCNPSRETGCSNIHALFSCTFIRFSHQDIKSVRLQKHV